MQNLSLANFKQLFEALPGLYLILDPGLIIVEASDSYLAATMTKREEVIGKNVFEVFPGNPDDPDGTDTKNLTASFEYVLRHKAKHTMSDLRFDIRREDGTYEQRFWRVSNTPVFNADQSIAWIINHVKDVTPEVRLELEALKLSREHERELQKINEELEEQVNAKTTQLIGIFENMTDGFIKFDREFRVTYVNKKISEFIHRDANEIIGKNIWDEFPDAVGSPTYNAIVHAMKAREYTYNTDYNPQLDFWQENHIYPSPEGLSMFVRDISERKKAEEILRASEQKYRYLFESNPMPMWMLSMPERDFIDVNEAAIKHYGYSREEFLSMNARDIRPDDEKDKFVDSLALSQSGIYNAGIWKHLKKDGTTITVEIMAHDNYFEGKRARLILANDITERLKAEEAYRQSEEINRLIMSSSLNAIVCMDMEGRIIFWNPQAEKIFGWEKEEIIGRRLAETIAPTKYREGHQRGLEHYKTTGEGPILKKLVEITALHKNGYEFNIELAIIPVKENDNEFFCAFIQDITERKKSEERLKESHEQLRQLALHLQDVREEEQKRIAREVHDELGQQITGIKMDVSWLTKKLAGAKGIPSIEDKLKEMTSLLDAAVRTIRKIASELRPSILDDLGVVAALEWQTKEFEKRFDIPAQFRSSVAYLELEPAVATGLFRLYQESLTNIARHADAKTVDAAIDIVKGQVVLTVTDDGKGFDVAASATKKTLGLLGMRERLLMMNGELNIKSNPGKGTSIIINIPITEFSSKPLKV